MTIKDIYLWCITNIMLLHIVNDSVTLRLQMDGKPATYKAAVYEHSVIFPEKIASSYDEAVLQMFQNLHVYKEQADKAGKLVCTVYLY